MNLASLKRKWHGLPVWAWAVITALMLYLLWIFLRNRGSGTNAATTPDTSASGADSGYDPSSYGSGSGSILVPNSDTQPFEAFGSSLGGNTVGDTNGIDTGNNVADQTPTVAATAPTTTVAAASSPVPDMASTFDTVVASPKPVPITGPGLGNDTRKVVQETTGNVGAIARGDVIAIPPPPDPVEQSLQGQHPGVKITRKSIPEPMKYPSQIHRPGAQL